MLARRPPMIRYVAAACALKAFSATAGTQRLYRTLGNRFGGPLRRRETYLRSHIARGELFRKLAIECGIANGGENLLEIGTGWVHWHSIYHRLFFDSTVTMFDVWDCRQFEALQTVFGDLMLKWGAVPPDEHARQRLRRLLACDSFDEIYDRMGLTYLVDESGALDGLPDQAFDCVFSFHVLEHVPKENTADLVRQMYRVLKPRGYSIHQIGIDDHLTHHDMKESPKNYLKYSETTWRRFFENELQYINLLQMSDWHTLFEANGFELMLQQPMYCDLEGLNVHARFRHYSEDDLRCTILTLVHRKPG
jgi:SAM-dependent methyltransferase